MGKITPTISFTSNSDQATTNAGPGSFAVAASISDSLSVDLMEQKLIETSGTVTKLLDGSVVGGGTETPATVGCYIFLRNNSSTTNENIYIGIVAGGGSYTPGAPDGSGGSALDEATNSTLRTFTLLPGEFAWFPFDYTGDIYYESATGTPALEYWRWDKA